MSATATLRVREDLCKESNQGTDKVMLVVVEGSTRDLCEGHRSNRMAYKYANDNWSPFARQAYVGTGRAAKRVRQDINTGEDLYQRTIAFLEVK